VILSLYGDDSSDKRQQEMLSAGAVLGWPHNLFDAERFWVSRLKKDQIAYFRASDCENFIGEFDLKKLGGLSQGRAIVDSLLLDLRTILKNNAIGGIAFSVLLSDFRDLILTNKKARAYYGTDPKIAVYKTLIKTTIEYLNRDWPQSRGVPISFVFDSHSGYLAAEKAYNDLRGIPLYGDRMAYVGHGDDVKTPPLQMADMIAYEARYKTLAWLGKREERPAFQKLAAAHSIYVFTLMNRKGMLTELRSLRKPRKRRKV